MKKIYFLILATFIFLPVALKSQNAIVGAGFTNGWDNSDFKHFDAGAGTSYIRTETANGTGDQYFRMGIDWSGTVKQITITPGSDTEVSPENEITLNTTHTTSGAMYLDISNTSDNYIFKTRDAGTAPSGDLIIFRVQGEVRTITSVSQSPSTVYPGQQVTVTATLDGTLNTGQGAYLRYSTDGWTTSTFVDMTYMSGNDYSAVIDASANTPTASFSYYVFTSGDALSIVHANADWYTINLESNSGANYSYSVQGGWTTASDGNWSNAATWADNAVPSATENMGAVTIGHDVTLNQNAKASSVTISALKTLSSESSGNRTLTIESNGTFTNSGIFTANDGSVVFLGTGTVTGTVIFNNVTINGGVDFGASSTVAGVLTLETYSWVNTNCPTYGGSSTLKYNTGGNFMIADEWKNTPQDVTISGSGTDVHIDENGKTISGNLLVENDASLTIDAAKDLTIEGNFTINSAKDIKAAGMLTLKSDATGTASMIINNDAAVSGEINVERFLSGTDWHFLSSPVQNQKIVGVGNFIQIPDNYGVDFYKFDETNTTNTPWINIENNEGQLNTDFGTPSGDPEFEDAWGYLVAYSGSNIIKTFTGVPNTGILGNSITNTADGRQGWNLVGNPYQSAVDWESGANVKEALANGFYYVYNQDLHDGAGDFEYYYSSLNPNTNSENVNGKIPAMQAFYVKAKDGGGSFALSPFARVHDNQEFFKKVSNSDNILTLEITGNQYQNKTKVAISNQSTTGADYEDAYQIYSLSDEVPHIYTYVDGDKLAVNNTPFPDEEYGLPLGIKVGTAGTYTITAAGIENFNSNIFPFLEDTQTNMLIDLRIEGSYTFEVSDAGINNSRFILHMKNTVGIDEFKPGSELAVAVVDHQLRVYNLEAGNYEVRVMDIMSRLMQQETLNSQNTLNLSPGIKAGAYIVQISGKGGQWVEKVTIK